MKSKSLERFLAGSINVLLWIIPLLPLYISSSMLFPFITGRNFAFRIIVEVLFLLWVGLAVVSEQYRPKLTPLVRALLIFIFVVALADIFGVNPYRSLWSNYERMEGLIGLLHMVVFFFITSSLFKKITTWRLYLYGSSVVSFIVAVIGVSQRLGFTKSFQGGVRVDGTIGNPAYLAAYLMFHVFFLLFFLWREERSWLRWIGFFVIAFNLYVTYLTATRGVLLGLVVVGAALAILVALKRSDNAAMQNIRRIAIGVLAAAAILIAAFFLLKDSAFVRRSPVLSRFANLSFTERTVQSRFIIWNIAWQGVKERPILGWGQENFYAVFGKYYDPRLWASEPWFDRSHNIVFDWLIHAGVVGLLAYLGVLVMVARNIWVAFKKRAIDFYEAAVLGGLLAAYIFQNLFVFDNFQSYMLFFLFAGLTNWLAYGGESAREVREGNRAPMALGALAAGAVVMAAVIYFANIKPILASQEIIQGLYALSSKNVNEVKSHLETAVSYRSFGTGEAVEQGASAVRNFTSNAGDENVKRYFDFIIAQLKSLVSVSHPDAKHYLFLGAVYRMAMVSNNAFIGEAIKSYEKALELSPKKQATLFDFSNLYLILGDVARARQLLEEAVASDPSFPNAHLNLAVTAALDGKIEVAREEAEAFFKLRPEPTYGELDFLVQAYARGRNFAEIKRLLERVIGYTERHYEEGNRELAGELSTVYSKYAAVLLELGDRAGAIAAAQKAGEINPAFKPDADAFIESIRKMK